MSFKKKNGKHHGSRAGIGIGEGASVIFVPCQKLICWNCGRYARSFHHVVSMALLVSTFLLLDQPTTNSASRAADKQFARDIRQPLERNPASPACPEIDRPKLNVAAAR